MKAFKQIKELTGLFAIRKRLGLTQQQLADRLKVSRSTIMMTELGNRSLPTDALLEAAKLEINLSTTGEVHMHPHPAEQDSIEKCKHQFKKLFEQESACNLKSRKLTAQLTQMQTAYQRTREWLHYVEMSIEQHGQGNMMSRELQRVTRKLNSCSLAEQAVLAARIAILDAQVELHRTMQGNLKKQMPAYFLSRKSELNV